MIKSKNKEITLSGDDDQLQEDLSNIFTAMIDEQFFGCVAKQKLINCLKTSKNFPNNVSVKRE